MLLSEQDALIWVWVRTLVFWKLEKYSNKVRSLKADLVMIVYLVVQYFISKQLPKTISYSYQWTPPFSHMNVQKFEN